MPSGRKSPPKGIREKFGAIPAGAQKHKRQGEVMLVEDFKVRIGRASQPNDHKGRYGETEIDTNGVEVLRFF